MFGFEVDQSIAKKETMKIARSFMGIFLVAVSATVHADGWAVLGKQAAMKNYAIADVGEVSQVDPPNDTQWEKGVYQMNERCFHFSSYMNYWGYGSKAALLLVNAQKDVKIALFETAIGSVKADVQSVVMVECPSGSNVIPHSDDLKEQLRQAQKRQEELKKKLEQLQRQK